MSAHKKYFSFKHYLSVLRRSSVHTQHVAAGVFAGIVTALIAAIILYYDYGFWRDTYSKQDENPVVEDTMVTVQSPSEMIGGFLQEATSKFKAINVSKENLLQGKDSYSKKE